MYIKKCLGSGALLLAIVATVPIVSQANTIFNVTLDTTALQGKSLGLLFQLNDGSQAGNNSVTVGNFSFGGGTAADCATLPLLCVSDGGASGNINTNLSLVDSSPFNSYLQQFTSGTSLSFQVDLTTNVDVGGTPTPDVFTFGILDATTDASLPTVDPSGSDTLLSINIDSANPIIDSYGSDPLSVYSFNVPQIELVNQPPPPPVNAPEPDSLLLMAVGLLALMVNGHQKLRKRVSWLTAYT